MGPEILDYILLALIFAIIINVFMKIFNKKCSSKEHMEEPHVEKINKSLFDRMKSEDLTDQRDDAVAKIIRSQRKCPVDDMEDEMSMYMREVIHRNRENCPGKVQFSSEEILDHQNNFFGFNNKVNHSSSNEVDMVDKLNEIHTSDNNEMTHYEGKKISDIFNGLTQSNLNKEKSCPGGKCLVPPHVDAQHHSSSYKTKSHDGHGFSKFHWKYENDSVSNGGKFYDDVEGSDSEFENNLVIEK